MVVKDVNEKYKCNVCGNEIVVTKAGCGTLVCCGEEMELINNGKKKSIIEEGLEVDDKNDEEEEEMEDYEKEEKEEEEEI